MRNEVIDVADNAIRAVLGKEQDEKNSTHLSHDEILAKMTDRNGRRLQCGDRVVLKDGRRGQIHYWTERGGSIHLDDPTTVNGYDYTHVDVDLTTVVKMKTITERIESAQTKHPDMFHLFRVGDNYTVYHAGAVTLSRAISLLSTFPLGNSVACQFPHSQLESVLRGLIKRGIKVAIFDVEY